MHLLAEDTLSLRSESNSNINKYVSRFKNLNILHLSILLLPVVGL